MRRSFFLAALLTLSACNLLPPSAPPSHSSVALSASVTQGEIPLAVTFTADATPPTATFRWVIGGAVQEETSSILTHLFTTSGLYVVTASTGDASDSVTVSVSGNPNQGPSPAELSLNQTPGGPAPWGVAYAVEPAVDGLQAQCTENGAYQRVVEGHFACLHEPGDTVEVRYIDVLGEITVRAEASPEIRENDGVAFAGSWRYTSRGVTETFAITEGSVRAGRSADGRFELFTIRQKGLTIAEFTIDGRTVVLEPIPDADGRQRFVASVYGLELERLGDAAEPGMEQLPD